MSTVDRIISHKMIGILRGYDTKEALDIAETLISNDFNVLEVALNSPDAKETLRRIKAAYGHEVLLGAGTVLTVDEAKECMDIGAEFLLSPVYNAQVLQFSKENGMLYIPGCYSPTEIYHAYESGAEMIKVFPANQLKPSYIKDVLAPMNDLVLLPTGGVTPDNINEFLRFGAQAVGINSALVPKRSEVDDALLDEVKERVQSFKGAIKQNED
ncbi:bifunctional 4-hydroxy-2-oxoglutarate aldolase/2-dehydro-3-deoxy-phosphogluconate aldolase [Salinicoccus albus]|uniref:bifunctional 4-hydroxy-2-oxoglutarate aldolase/2-dehydro-3-deoxy-phosphogluconate aldolase n=1 Tax=Salinicoccus albus TaxID=418756 RepID=UPI0003681959|nr:bifunctional 4-hydroxy-2-oxoglutarate aldolase/2-dehydro-3-deoxy-phosphogluconate aldolase [Salinicoccus albus]